MGIGARVQDEEYWAPMDLRSGVLTWVFFAVAFVTPAAVLLTMARTVVGWTVGVAALTAPAIWLPISFAQSTSSTAGLALLVPLSYGVPAAALVGVADVMARERLTRRSRGLRPRGPG